MELTVLGCRCGRRGSTSSWLQRENAWTRTHLSPWNSRRWNVSCRWWKTVSEYCVHSAPAAVQPEST